MLERITLGLLAIACSAIIAPAALAGGLYVHEFATPSTGTANAGAGALGRDASTALHNPAAMTRLDEHQLLTGIAPGFSTVEFDPNAGTPIAGNDGGDQGGFIPLISSHYVHVLNDYTRLGIGLFSVSGAALDPRNGWAGRAQTTEITLFTLSVQPSLGVKITDSLSVSGGALVLYGSLDAELRPPLPGGGEGRIKLKDMEDSGTAPIASLFYEPTDDLRFGLFFQDEIQLNLSGDVKTAIAGASVDLDFDFPRRLLADAYWQATDDVALLFSLGWEDWSTLNQTVVSLTGTGTVVKLGMRDTFKIGGGIEYRLREDLLLQTGVTYDSSPLQTKNRTVALPVDRQIRFGVGTIWNYSESVTVAFNFEYADLGRAPVKNNLVRGSYDTNSLFLFGVSLNFKDLPWKNWGKIGSPSPSS